jgi:uncharacterized protein (TIGR02145 family)
MADGKRWMTQNLNLKVDKSYCYKDNPANCDEYGRLYEWKEARKACSELGDNWHLPSDRDWAVLLENYGEKRKDSNDYGKDAYKVLIKGGVSGFNARLSGLRDAQRRFYNKGKYSAFWSSKKNGSDGSWSYSFRGDVRHIYRDNSPKEYALSCRCVQD